MPAREQPRAPRVPTKAAIEAAAPWLPADYTRADVVAWQALQAGTADKAQQQRCLRWLVYQAAGTYEATYHPGPDGARNSDFAQGKRWVGQQVVKLTLLNPGLVREDNPNADKYEPPA